MIKERIIELTAVIVNADEEATAATMSAALYYMLKKSKVYEKAESAVRSSLKRSSEI